MKRLLVYIAAAGLMITKLLIGVLFFPYLLISADDSREPGIVMGVVSLFFGGMIGSIVGWPNDKPPYHPLAAYLIYGVAIFISLQCFAGAASDWISDQWNSSLESVSEAVNMDKYDGTTLLRPSGEDKTK